MSGNANGKASAPRLQVRGIKKAFGQNVVLKGIDLSVDAGEVIALIGGNGAGKQRRRTQQRNKGDGFRPQLVQMLFHRTSPSIL